MAHRWSDYISYSKYIAHVESILVLRVIAVLAAPMDEILPVLVFPTVQTPEIPEI